VKPFFDQALQETIEHAEAIAGHIQSLGHVPKLSLKPAIGGGVVTREEALAEALEFERQALEAYQDMLPRVAGNASLEKFIQQQITVETEHVQEIERMLD
jgi:bacterioferritin (cytochrome b1)